MTHGNELHIYAGLTGVIVYEKAQQHRLLVVLRTYQCLIVNRSVFVKTDLYCRRTAEITVFTFGVFSVQYIGFRFVDRFII